MKYIRTIILPFVFYGCENLVCHFDEHRLRVFMNRVMKIFGPKRYEVAGKWRRLKEGAYDLYCTSNIIQVIKWRRMTWARHTVSMRNTRGTYRHLVGRPKGKRPLWKM